MLCRLIVISGSSFDSRRLKWEKLSETRRINDQKERTFRKFRLKFPKETYFARLGMRRFGRRREIIHTVKICRHAKVNEVLCSSDMKLVLGPDGEWTDALGVVKYTYFGQTHPSKAL